MMSIVKLLSCPIARGKLLLTAGLAAVGLVSGSCVVFDAIEAESTGVPLELDPRDPFESTNRLVYSFNSELDTWIVAPAARAYDVATPSPVKGCIGNFFSNLREPSQMLGYALLRDQYAVVNSYSRFVTNTILGLGGCFDPATSMGMKHKRIDLGLVARSYGLDDDEDSTYLMLPLFGPTTLIDGTANWAAELYVNPQHSRNAIGRRPNDHRTIFNPYVTTNDSVLFWSAATKSLHRRHFALGTSDVIQAAALDPYLFLRYAYYDRRNAAAKRLTR